LSKLLAAALVALSLLAPPAFALDASATAAELMRSSGMWEQLGHAQMRIDAALSQLPSNKTADALRAAAHEAYTPSRLRERASREIAEGLDPKHTPAVVRWYSSPDGTTITRAEAQASASSLDINQAVQLGQEKLRLATPARRRLLERLLATSKAVDATVEMATQEVIAVRRGVAAAIGQPDKVPNEAELKKMFEAQRPMVEKSFRERLLASFALTYHPLPDATLERYVGFLASPEGSHFNALGIRAITRALGEAAETMGGGLGGKKT
jgi:hypothetical protein